MLVPNFCAPFNCYSAVETFIRSKENIFYKTKIVFLSFFKYRRTQLVAFVIWKSRCVVFCLPKHWNMFVRVLFVTYLKVFFDEYLSFILTFVLHYCDSLCDTFYRPFGNLYIDILTLASTAKFYFSLAKNLLEK